MSYGQNGANGFANGYRSQGNRYDEDSGNRDTSGSSRRTRRAGGYGGFNGDSESDRLDSDTRQDRGANGHSYNRSTGSSTSNRYGNSYGASQGSSGYDPNPPPRSRDRDREMEPNSFRTRNADRERETEPNSFRTRNADRDRETEPTSFRTRNADRERETEPTSFRTRNADRETEPTSFRTRNADREREPASFRTRDNTERERDREPTSLRSRDNLGRDRDRDGETTSFRSRDRLRPSQSDSRMYGDGPVGKQLEDVVEHINDKWSIMTKSDCVPVQVSLQLMDTSSLGRGNDYNDFQQTAKALHKSLKAIVNEHHQGFNSSIGTFHKIQTSIQNSQERVGSLKASLMTAKANLTVTRAGLKGLASSSQNYDDMLQVLTQIEKIQTMPEQLDGRISEKQFLSAVDVLQDALRMIRHSSLENIGALSDLRLYLNNQETSLTDILLEELHDHLYLKSPYTQNRWRSHPQGPGDVAVSGQSAESSTAGIRSLYRFLTSLNMSQPLVQNPARNPEEDSFEYIHMLIEALNKMGRLDFAVEQIEQRLPVELNSVVEKTNQEVDQRHPKHLRTSTSTEWTQTKIRAPGTDTNETVLIDLLYTLYSKFEAIAEGHRALHDVISGIIQRERLKKTDGLTKGFKELWKLYQSEMRSLLHDYLATDGNLMNQRDASAGTGNIFKRNQRDKNKRVFRMVDLDRKQLSTEQEELDKILQSSVPGLVSKSSKHATATTKSETNNYESASASHKLLVEPSVFNISVLLPPSLVFLQRLKDTVPPDSDIAVSTLTSFLDDFLLNVFTPQLDDTVTELCSHSFVQMDAFQEDPSWAEQSQLPIFKGAVTFFSLIKDFCKMLDNIPQDQMFTSLLLSQLKTYQERCIEWSEGLLSRVQDENESKLKPAAATVKEGGEIYECVKAIWEESTTSQEEQQSKLMDLLITRMSEKPIGQFDIITDRRAANALCLLYSSLQWLAAQLQRLKTVVKRDDSRDSQTGRHAHRWTMISAAAMRDADRPVTLPLTEESAGSFDTIMQSYEDLARRTLYTLQLDIRFRLLQTGSSLLEAPYMLLQPVNEPDQSIMQLNNDLLTYDEATSRHLPDKERLFLTSGLGTLLDSYSVTNCAKIKSMNSYGCNRMLLNISVLRQNLKNLEKAVSLSRSTKFFEYFLEGPKAIVNAAKETGGEGLGFSLDEFKTLVELCYSEALQSEQREVQSQAKRNMGEDTLQLTEYMWSV